MASMKYLISLMLVSACVGKMSFEDYGEKFGKIYASEEEREMRRQIFEKNARRIESHPKSSSFTRGFNHFTDRKNEEIPKGLDKHLLHFQRKRWKHEPILNFSLLECPESLDYSDVLTPVKNQGKCGSCWTFASAETVESHWALKTGMLMELSEQFILDCTPNPEECGGTGGCGGGTAELAYARLTELGGIPTEWEYPYVSILGNASTCHGIPLAVESPHAGVPAAAANVTGYWHTRENSYEDMMMALVKMGPLAVSVDAGGWHDYTGGIFDGGNLTNPNLDHLVQLVGYGTEDGVDYWRLRNSWTPLWGEGGFIRIRRFDPRRGDVAPCGMDLTPQDGNGCKGGPDQVKVCGMSGVLYDGVIPLV